MNRIKTLLYLLLLLLPASCTYDTHADNLSSYSIREYDPKINTHIVKIARSMPRGGGYSTRQDAFDALQEGVSWNEDKKKLNVSPRKAQPSFCSSACYLVILQLLQKCRDHNGNSPFDANVWRALSIQPKHPDGEGIWGRVNANGGGLAKFIKDIGAGYSFTNYDHAKPGDFLKIFWTDHIGKKEHGHLVIYLGQEQDSSGTDMVRFWSSNSGIGYSEKSVPKSSIKRALFTRISSLRAFDRVTSLPYYDEWLASHLTRSFTEKEMHRMCGVRKLDKQLKK